MLNVLLTGCSEHAKEMVGCFKDNFRGEPVRVVGIDSDGKRVLKSHVDASYEVPRFAEPEYMDVLKGILEKEHIDIIMPFITQELLFMAENRKIFDDMGIKVSISSLESLEVANDKINLNKRFPKYMAEQQVAFTGREVRKFAIEHGYPEKRICVKLRNRAGGTGFCVADEAKGRNILLHNIGRTNSYVTLDMLCELVDYYPDGVIVSEYIEGIEYSLCILADHGEIIHSLGFEGYTMQFGSCMTAAIRDNERAYIIADNIVRKIGLDGNACFDYRISPEGDVVLLEINPRLSASLPFIKKAGLNLPYLRCLQLMGEDVRGLKFDLNKNLTMRKYYETEFF